MNRVRVKIAVVALVVAGSAVQAQSDPRQILSGMIQQVQTGRPNPNWYGAELWQLIAYQTGNTGVYPQLAQLGPVRDIAINQQLPLPIGVIYAMTAQHARGRSYWEFGISTLTNRIEYASFVAEPGGTASPLPTVPAGGTSLADLEDLEDDGPPTRSGKGAGSRPPRDTGSGSGSSGTTSDACRKFPNLCQ
jgi:hypothetical protein